jgi:class 3 adenylate cyclase
VPASVPAIVLIYDIRGFTAASKRLKTADLGAFATGAHRAILDLFAAHPPTFVKNLGDGHLLLWETGERPDPELLASVVEGARKARAAFGAFVAGQEAAGAALPKHVGLGVAFGEVSKSDDYYGVALNLAARLQNLARPEGMAVDRTVFEEVARRDEAFRTEFKRARVRLKGLGHTVVWVKRPFSWSRLARAAGPYAAVATLLLGYVALSSAGLRLPGAFRIQRWLDAHGMSLFRPARGEPQIRAAAMRARRELSDALLRARTKDGWFLSDFTDAALPEPKQKEPDVWAHSQAICALLKDPDLPPDVARSLLDGLDHAFRPGAFLEDAKGVPYGWAAHPGLKYTEAEPALWTVAALAVALGRPGLVPEERRPAMTAHLVAAQRAADLYRPAPKGGAWDGGWNMFPNQDDLERHAPYTTALALLALLETNAAGLPWAGSVPARDQALRATAGWLVRKFGTYQGFTGWQRTPDPADPVSVGLSFQIDSELLRAETEAGVPVPAEIVEALVRRLSEHAGEVPYDAGENEVSFTTHEGRSDRRNESINFLVDPWAIEAAQRWLVRADAKGADPADRVAVRRTLGRLVVDQEHDHVVEATSGWIFIASETLYALSSIPR